jgi:hypothetical protein
MANTPKYFKGERKGKLTLVALKDALTSGGNKKRIATVKCDCGAVFDKQANAFLYAKRPDLQMCDDCRSKMYDENPSAKKLPLFFTWRNMVGRCHDKKHHRYKSYGARGITVCKRWRGKCDNGEIMTYDGYYNFIKDMGDKPDDTSIDRIDNDKGYSPKNCRWADIATQHSNSRPSATVGNEKFSLTVVANNMTLGLTSEELSDKLELLMPKLTKYLLGE